MNGHQSDPAGSANPIARAGRRRRGSSLAVIAIWTADEIEPGRSGCQAAVATVLDDRDGVLRSGGDENRDFETWPYVWKAKPNFKVPVEKWNTTKHEE